METRPRSARITYVRLVCKIQGIQISSMSLWQSREYMQCKCMFFLYPSSQLPSKKQRPTPNAFGPQLDGKMMCSLLTVDYTEKRTHKPKLEQIGNVETLNSMINIF